MQMNVEVEDKFVELVEEIADHHGWSKVETIRRMIVTFDALMRQHRATAEKTGGKVGGLFSELATEMPAALVRLKEVKPGVVAGDRPALILDGWVIYRDEIAGELIAAKQDEDGAQIARIREGEFQPIAALSAEAAEEALSPAAGAAGPHLN